MRIGRLRIDMSIKWLKKVSETEMTLKLIQHEINLHNTRIKTCVDSVGSIEKEFDTIKDEWEGMVDIYAEHAQRMKKIEDTLSTIVKVLDTITKK